MPSLADEEATFLKGPHPKTAKDLTSNLPRVMPKADACLSETPKAVTEKAKMTATAVSVSVWYETGQGATHSFFLFLRHYQDSKYKS